MKAIYWFILVQAISLVYALYDIIKSNRKNGLFRMTALQVYLMKHHGLNAEEAEDEYINYLKCEREILDEIKHFCPTENYGRGEVAKYRDKHGLNT